MKLKNNQSNQGEQISPTLRGCLQKFNYQLVKPALLCASSLLSVAIALPSSLVYAEETASNQRVHPRHSLKQATSLLPVPSPEPYSVEPRRLYLLPDSIAQVDGSAPPASEPSAEPTSGEPTLQPAEPSAQPTPDGSTSPSTEPSAEPTPIDPTQPAEPSLEPTPDDSIPQPAEPSTQTAPSDRWQFSIEPFFFIPLSVKADVTAIGRTASIDAGFGDILNLDRAFDAGLRFQGQKGRAGFFISGFYLFAEQSGNLGVTFPPGALQGLGIPTAARVNADAKVSVSQGTIDVAGFYRVVDLPLGNQTERPNPFRRLIIDPFLGIRIDIFRLELEVDSVRIGSIDLPFSQDVSFSSTRVSPLIGATVGLSLSQRWAFALRGDISGFDIGAERDFKWNLLFGAQYSVSPTTSLFLGYQFNDYEFRDGEELRRSELDLEQNGLLLRAIFRF
jgi:hypothetical protein